MARISTQRLARLCHNLGSGLHAGLDIRRLWESECQRTSGSARIPMEGVRDRIASGESFAGSLKSANGFFPALFCEMTEVGERTGRMEVVFMRLAEHYDQMIRLRRNFLAGIAWPMLQLLLGICAVGLLIYILGAIGAEWDGERMTVLGLYGATGAMIWFGSIALIAVAIVAPIIAAQKGWISLDPLLRVLIHVPGIGRGLRIFAMSRLTWSLAMATDSDLPPDKAIELAVRSTQNGYYTDRLEQMKLAIRRGGEMHEAFRSVNSYPDDFLDALQTGEISGRTSETMMIVAKDYDERAKMWYRALAVACGGCVFLVVVALMVFMIFNLFFNLYMKPINDTLNSM